jgi:hypothetical protein
LSHRATGFIGSERPAPVPVPGTGRYRPVISFVLVPHTDWPTGPGWLLLLLLESQGQRQRQRLRPAAARAACEAVGGVLRWQWDGPYSSDGKQAWAVPVARIWSRICTYLYMGGGWRWQNNFLRVLFSPLRSRRAPPRPLALPTTGSGGPGTGSPVPVSVPVR